MKQQTLALAVDQQAQFEPYRRPTRRDVFLATMNEIVPWQALCEVIEQHYPKAGKVRYRGLAKNATRAFVALGLANISWRVGA